MSEPKWTLTKKVSERRDKHSATDDWTNTTTEWSLCYDGSPVHVLTGVNGESALTAFMNEMNASGYEPKMTRGRLYPELTQKQRDRLAFLSSPELPFTNAPD